MDAVDNFTLFNIMEYGGCEMKAESQSKISSLVIKCLEFTRENLTNVEKYPTVGDMRPILANPNSHRRVNAGF